MKKLLIVCLFLSTIALSCKKDEESQLIKPNFSNIDLSPVGFRKTKVKAELIKGNEEIIQLGFIYGTNKNMDVNTAQFFMKVTDNSMIIDTTIAWFGNQINYIRFCAFTKSGTFYSDPYQLVNRYFLELNYKGSKMMVLDRSLNFGFNIWTSHNITTNIGASSQDSGILNQQAMLQNSTSGIAKICDSMTYGGYNDWYVPSINELDFLYQYKLVTEMISGIYWSSTEFNSDVVELIDFNTGNHLKYKKNYAYFNCTCIRRD